jgi:hypothetical protein
MRHLIGIMVISLLAFGAVTNAMAEEETASNSTATASVTITSPTKNETVRSEAVAEGACSPSGLDHIWVFVQPEFSQEWSYPQSTGATHLSCSNGHWETPVFFGGRRQAFRVTVYLGTTDASKEIERFLAKHSKHSKKKGYPGMKLPNGLEEKAHVWVIKK